ncbi:SusE domain-containing protein [Spirosoma panaciterrae]|uniref:SusE domain-containing protein n=1 Tax=Spirosoma panaciterrae TaxID=496058 RepID=UPI000374E443|nr:SusE domain-containing protein [Spirosoma panaciterrae]
MKTFYWSNSGYGLKVIIGFLIGLVALQAVSCTTNEVAPQVTATPILTASTAQLTLSQANAAKPAVSFSWTPAAVSHMEGKVTYFIEWDRKGNNFANKAYQLIGQDSSRYTFTVGALNKFLGTLLPGAATDLEFRLVTATPDGSVPVFYSNAVPLSITTYSPVVALYDALWMVGDATPAGWNIDKPTPMVQDPGNPNLFTYSGNLSAGEFKIPVATGDWGTKFYRPLVNHPALTETGVQLRAGDPDTKWVISTAGSYKVSLNIKELTISIVKQ